ncbi:hypothetical protein ACOSP7_016891 [Xanthoceras sorbifolium]|uniref:Late embryogenesis abundant protein LEA-2 subgroup domain-containing protein n=1 Tax=Xanthoceras sorbifolium TaxID=99658 RepID=A0ABQ8HI63_9ROSI|nr:hypothetical protein JRO89_XS10G0093100 [Xanthoceras sorbifolium]
MSDKIHPREADKEEEEQEQEQQVSKLSPPSPDRAAEVPVPVPAPVPAPPVPGTYVIQIPKDQIYRVPPPDNALRYKHLSKPKKSRSSLANCCRCFFITLLVLFLLLAVAAAIFYFVFRPESLNYTVDTLSIKSFNLSSSSSSTISPVFDLSLSAHNPNNKLGIYYLKPSSVKLFYKDLNLCNGVLPQFFQPRNNVTVFKTALKAASALELTTSVHNELVAAEKAGTVPFRVNVRAPVKFKVGSVKSWTINVKVRCDVTVDKLTAESKIMWKKCDYSVDVW